MDSAAQRVEESVYICACVFNVLFWIGCARHLWLASGFLVYSVWSPLASRRHQIDCCDHVSLCRYTNQTHLSLVACFSVPPSEQTIQLHNETLNSDNQQRVVQFSNKSVVKLLPLSTFLPVITPSNCLFR